MNKKEILEHLAKIFERSSINESDTLESLEFDSLILLDLTTFNDKFFSDLDIKYEDINKCKNIGDIIRLYGKKIKN
tara:strand:+ start:1390 stop:1617 length:228 start_codon:yes stop_codon:yes gene_type:complete